MSRHLQTTQPHGVLGRDWCAHPVKQTLRSGAVQELKTVVQELRLLREAVASANAAAPSGHNSVSGAVTGGRAAAAPGRSADGNASAAAPARAGLNATGTTADGGTGAIVPAKPGLGVSGPAKPKCAGF